MAHNRDHDLSHLTHRQLIGWIGLLLPFVLFILAGLWYTAGLPRKVRLIGRRQAGVRDGGVCPRRFDLSELLWSCLVVSLESGPWMCPALLALRFLQRPPAPSRHNRSLTMRCPQSPDSGI